MTRRYPVIYEWAGKNFSGYAPDIAGCIATAKTLPLIRARLRGALEAHLKWMSDDGDSIPRPSETVTVDIEQDSEYPQPRGYHVIVERLDVSLPNLKTPKPRIATAKRTVATKRRVLQTA